jgi:septal ring factor EnvC (AmiA/AmiB activator)
VEESIIQTAAQQGIFAVLFVALFFYQLRESRRQLDVAQSREDKLMAFLNDISKQFESLDAKYEKISCDVTEIKSELREGRKPA